VFAPFRASAGSSVPALAGAIALGAALALLAACAPEPRPRSVLLVVVDTLRADRLGVYGRQRRPTSPSLDQFAAGAAVFERTWSTSSWTLPSYGSLLTGQLPSRHGAGARIAGDDPHAFAALDPGTPTLAERLAAAGFATAGIANNPFLRESFGVARGFDSWEYLFVSYDDHPRADVLVDRALAWLDAHARARPGEPFFLMLNPFDPHLPYDPGEPARGAFTWESRARLTLPFAGLGRANPHWQPAPPVRQFVEAAYDEEVMFLDAELGRLFEGLAARGLGQETLVVVTADHGEELFEHGGFEHGHTLYEELLRVPLLLAGPGVAPGRIAAPVSLVDLTPTILDALGLSVPEGLAGRSRWPLARGDAAGGDGASPETFVAESTLHGPFRRALVRWPWKLVVTEGAPPALYDLDADPGERRDRASADPGVVAELGAQLDALVAEAARGTSLEAAPLDPETRRQLEGLGYLEPRRPGGAPSRD
jgi:arylsulfatase A-like enzyme